jgi:hypothetical protein
MVAIGDSEAVRLASDIDASKLWCSSGDDEGTKGGGNLRRSFRDGRFSTGGGELHTEARVLTIADQNSS